jgi:hypothetical protein
MSYLFVGNISKNVKEELLHSLFSKCGLCAVELKGPYAFVRYSKTEEANKAINKYNNTNLEGINGHNKARIEFSKKNPIDDFLANKFITQNNLNASKGINLDENLENQYSPRKTNYYKNDERDREKKNKNRNNNKDDFNNNFNRNNHSNIRANNVCFICKLPGHFAKECVLTKDTCYECGIKGHMAKECQAGVREAKSLNFNRVKAIFSQKSSYKYLTHKQKFNLYKNFLSNSNSSN